jgi:hypothetical protein
MRYYDIIDHLEFIKGNVIADERRLALQQIKELIDKLMDAAEMPNSLRYCTKNKNMNTSIKSFGIVRCVALLLSFSNSI